MLIWLFVGCGLYAQPSARYMELLNSVTPKDSIPFEAYYNNGQLKEKGSYLVYELDGVVYELYTGTFEAFQRNGLPLVTKTYDAVGTEMEAIYYSGKDGISLKIESIKIDTDASSISEFLGGQSHINWTDREKHYAYDNVLCKMYLKQEGLRQNGRKIGTWSYYYPDGSLKKEKNFD